MTSVGAPSPQPPDRARARKAKAARHLWRSALEFGVALFATVVGSRLLLHLSGQALWLPREWRGVLEVLVPLFGMVIYTSGRHVARLWMMESGHEGEHAGRTRAHKT